MSEPKSELIPEDVAGHIRQLQALIESAPQGLLLLDDRQRLLVGNSMGLDFLQLLLPDATPRPLGPGSFIGALGGMPLAALLDGESHEIDLEAQQNGRRFTVTSHAVAGAGPGEPSWTVIIHDVTERRRQSELSRQQERLAAVGQLAAGIAHDFNNILSSVVLYAQLLEREPQLSADGQRRLNVIQEQVRRASELVRQLLDFSRRSVLQRHEVELVSLCYELVEGWRRTLLATIDIHFHHHADRYVVEGDASRLKQALLNLALNAQEAMHRGGSLSLALTHRRIGPGDTVPQLGMDPGLWLQLTVADSGAGIPPEALPHVFEPFFSTKPLHEGAGLGLAQVHGIVHQHGGHVKIQSEPNRGTLVTVYLPLRDVGLPAVAAPAAGRPAVLIVEQDDRLRKALGDALQPRVDELGHRLIPLGAGQEAVDLVRRQSLHPALIIGDLALPRMSGLALLQAMRSLNPDCRMIIISSYPMPANSSHLHAAGIAAWLPKPFTMPDLLQQVEKVLAP